MCGIAGVYYFDPQAQIDERILRRMTDLLKHRGPDDSGYYAHENIGLGHRRLTILDLSEAGRQPMSNEDGSVWIAYNGECYNYQAFSYLASKGHQFKSTSDTEVLLHLYEEHGLDFLDKIDGMYAFAIWDAPRRRLLLVRDRIGIKPLYYYQDAAHIVFASELKALLADPDVPSELNYSALGSFFRLMSIPDPETVFRGVQKLPAGHYLLVESGRVERRQYWDVSSVVPLTNYDLATACAEFEMRFRETVASHLIADVPVGAFLSGGVDSSTVVAMASQASNEPLRTFSITFKGLLDFDESPQARTVAGRFHTDHHEFDLTPNLIDALPRMVYHADEPFAISSGFALYFLSRLASQHVKVVLSGDGGDEVFAGYPWRHGQIGRRLNQLPLAIRGLLRQVLTLSGSISQVRNRSDAISRIHDALRRIAAMPDERYARSITNYQDADLSRILLPDSRQLISGAWADHLILRYYHHFGQADELTRKLYTDLKSTLVSEMLTKVDRMTMAFGLEARVPFLDHHLVDWAFRIPGRHKLHGSEGKYLVKKAMEQHLPSGILYRPKHGFNVPIKVWMRHELREFIHDTLSVETLRTRGLFQAEAATQMVEAFTNGTDRQDRSNQVFALLVLELWLRQFVDERQRFRAN